MNRLSLVAPLVALCACTSREFPEKFLFGTAIAGFQVDMGCPTTPAKECDDTKSDWYQWINHDWTPAEREQIFLIGGKPSTGPGMYELFPADFTRAKDELHLGAIRLSIEWSRVFPDPTFDVEGHEALKAKASAAGLDFYHRQFAKLKALGLTPFVTLNHYTMPTWIHDGVACRKNLETCPAKGWLDPRTIKEIAKYAGFVAKEFAGEVDLWATENEPFAVVVPAYVQASADRSNPPALSFKQKEGKQVAMALIEAHARMYDAVKANDTSDADGDGVAEQTGIVLNLGPTRPLDPDDPDDVQGADNLDYLYNRLFLNAIVNGEFDGNADRNPVKRDDLGKRLDFLGINYYTRLTIDGTASSLMPDFSPLLTVNPLSSKLWEDYPRGIYEVTKFVWDTYKVPIYITETGYSEDGYDKKPRPAGEAARLMVHTVSWLKKAIDDGADVRGIFWWSLMDNYEWNHGMEEIRMGLYAVDGRDPQKKRTIRESGKLYGTIAQARGVTAELDDENPIGE